MGCLVDWVPHKSSATFLQIVDLYALKQISACAELFFSFESYHAILGRGERHAPEGVVEDFRSSIHNVSIMKFEKSNLVATCMYLLVFIRVKYYVSGVFSS